MARQLQVLLTIKPHLYRWNDDADHPLSSDSMLGVQNCLIPFLFALANGFHQALDNSLMRTETFLLLSQRKAGRWRLPRCNGTWGRKLHQEIISPERTWPKPRHKLVFSLCWTHYNTPLVTQYTHQNTKVRSRNQDYRFYWGGSVINNSQIFTSSESLLMLPLPFFRVESVCYLQQLMDTVIEKYGRKTPKAIKVLQTPQLLIKQAKQSLNCGVHRCDCLFPMQTLSQHRLTVQA